MEDCPEGEHLRFKAHVRGWKTEAREARCQSLLGITTEHNLRRVFLGVQWKDVLLVPQAWYPEYTPKYETKGWWYVSEEEVLGRTCKTCKAFCELTDFIGTSSYGTYLPQGIYGARLLFFVSARTNKRHHHTKRQRTGSVNYLKCNPPGGLTGTHSKHGNTKSGPRRKAALTLDGSASNDSALRRSQRAKGQKSAKYHEESEIDSHSDNDRRD
jgi:hypothetical protein